jgi:MOSC domain-containing protein YiiM
MQLISVNIGQERAIKNAKSSGKTGIYKLPVSTPVQINALGLPGDAICDTASHGGVDQAVYVYTGPDYAWWSQELGQELGPGTFGENLTLSELESAMVRIGDRFNIGSVVLEVTSPRIPCVTLAARMGDPEFVKRFKKAERPGFYCRVVREGSVQAGDGVTYTPYQGETVSLLEMFRDFYKSELDEATMRHHLAGPIHYKDRDKMQERLRKLGIDV